MSRRATARRIITPSQLGADRMAALQEACEFDLAGASMGAMRMTVLKHDTLLRSHRLDGRQADLGLTYRVVDHNLLSGRHRLVCSAFGHAAHPHATQFIYEQKSGMDVSDFLPEERDWLEGLAVRYRAIEDHIAAGRDPRNPGGAGVASEPCLVRLLRHHGVGVDEFLARIPRHGQFIVGRGWRRASPAPRVVEVGDVQAHLVRTAARLQVVRIGLGAGLSYEPPDRDKTRRTGILYVMRTELPSTMRTALVGQPLERLVEHPALDPGLRIKAISASGSGLAVRVEGCLPPRTMDLVDTIS